MKKNLIIVFFIIVIVSILITTIVLFNNKTDKKESSNNIENKNEDKIKTEDIKEEVQTNKIKLTVESNEILVTLDDSDISHEFQSMLPMTLSFEDFNNTEKIAYLENKLDTSNSPEGYTPEIGDFAYYAPWGNISIFYEEFRYSSSLIKLGKIDSGVDIIQNLKDDTKVVIEKVN